MDWSPDNAVLEPAASDPATDAADGSVGINFNTSRRAVARKISHRKNPSDTFAFAAGQLFHHTPEDFYNLLEVPLEYANDSQAAGQAAGSAARPLDPCFGGHQQQAGHAHALGTLEARSSSFDNLHVQVPGAAPSSLATTPTSTSFAAAGTAAAAAAQAAGSSSQAVGTPTAAQLDPAAAAAAAASDEPEQHGSGSGSGLSATQTRANALDTATLDPRRAKRILANRQSAQRSRMKRLQYIHDLEKRSAATTATLKELQAEIGRMQTHHAEHAEAVEARKAQVSTLSQQLQHEQALQAALISQINALRQQAQPPWLHQQQHQSHQQPWPHPQQQHSHHYHHQQAGGAFSVQQQQRQQQLYIKQEQQHHQDMQMPYYANHQQQQQQQQHQQQAYHSQHQQQQQQLSPHGYHPDAVRPVPDAMQLHRMDLGQMVAAADAAAAAGGERAPFCGADQRQLQQQAQLPQHHHLAGSSLHGTSSGGFGSGLGLLGVQVPNHDASMVGMGPGPAGLVTPGSNGMRMHKSLPQQQQQQQGSGVGGSSTAFGGAGFLALHRTPSPSKPLGGLDFPGLGMGLAASDSTPMPDLEEGDFEGLLQDQSFLAGGLCLAPSGELGLRQDDICGVQPAGNDPRKTSSM